jgi:molybdopterin converting factor small subunit
MLIAFGNILRNKPEFFGEMRRSRGGHTSAFSSRLSPLGADLCSSLIKERNAMANANGEPSYVAKQRLNLKISGLETEIASVEEDISRLQALRQNLLAEKLEALRELQGHSARPQVQAANKGADASGSGSGKGKSKLINYAEEFEWSRGLKDKMKRVFGINNFRLCQEG